MLKEYFTDGLIGLAIILSIFRTDLVGINNLINYPEVQDIIMGQTAAYMPANFHHIHNSPHAFANPKHLDFDNQAFSAWYQNINNLPSFRRGGENNIEAFLVSLSHQNVVVDFQSLSQQNQVVDYQSLSQQNVAVDYQSLSQQNVVVDYQGEITGSSGFQESHVEEISSHSLVEEISSSLMGEEHGSISSDPPSNVTSSNETVLNAEDVGTDVYSVLNSPFPGCNLTKEDLKLIDILYQQDVDLGVGKEVFDPSFREELERERELELIKQQEMQKAQLLAEEKKEQETKELQDKWLKKNFRRDGETGEWVQLQNWTVDSTDDLGSQFLVSPAEGLQEAFTIEDALDFLGNFEKSQQSEVDSSTAPVYATDNAHELQFAVTPEQEQLQGPFLQHQDSLVENWNSLVDYLNMTANSGSEDSGNNNDTTLYDLSDQPVSPLAIMSDLGLEQDDVDDGVQTDYLINDDDVQTADYLINNATLPSVGVDLSAEFNVLTPMEEFNSSMPLQSADINSIMDFDLSFFNNFTTLQNESHDDFDLAEGTDPFGSVQETSSEVLVDRSQNLAESMDAIQMMEENLSMHALVGEEEDDDESANHDFAGVFDALEGATGGSEYTSDHGDLNNDFSKVAYLSESSNDSGFINQGGSSPSSSSTGSPAGSQNGLNSSSSSNDTEHDPPGTRTVAQQHVAHNHTYNTPPGQVPREVKKYAQKEPSRKGPQSRDQRRADELKIPFTLDDIIESSVETFNEMLAGHKLNEAQLILIRDIRRRGKNKVAAQNCRKRKVSVIFNLSDEMTELQKMRDRLMAERAAMDRERRRMKEKFGHLYTHIFQSLRDERGEPYDPSQYSLQQSSDGNVFLVPRNITVNKSAGSSSPSSSSSSSNDSTGSKKRKSYDN